MKMLDEVVVLFGAVALGILSIFLIGLIFSFPVMLLWNGCLVPAVAGLSQIGWLQALGIMILTGFLFKSSSTNKTQK